MSHSNNHAYQNDANEGALPRRAVWSGTPDSLAAAMIESCSEAFMAITMDGLICSWNSAAERLSGYTAREVLGKPWQMLSHPDDKSRHIEAVQRFERKSETFRVETRLVRKDGLTVQILLSISAILDSAGNLIGLSGLLRDITEDKQAAEKLRQS